MAGTDTQTYETGGGQPPPGEPPATRVRQDIWQLEQDDPFEPVTLAYALAIAEMQQRPPSEPTSWAYQAAVHGVPPGMTPDQFLDQCQHNSWFFLPWHRIYLFWFEAMIRDLVKNLSDIPQDVRDGWALPYWNYGRGAPADALPPAFREQQLPNGDDNPLFVPQRSNAVNGGARLPAQLVSAAAALQETAFSEPPMPGLPAGFGGPVTEWHHFGELTTIPGALEGTPHNTVHGTVGGPGGFMSAFDTAPLDPIFWLHHCNIDRLWEVWLQQGGGRSNPDQANWTGFEFDFHDEQSQPVKGTPGGVVSTVDLGYEYSDLSLPALRARRGPMAAQPPERPELAASEPPSPSQPPELAGATEAPMELAGQPASVSIPLQEPERLTARLQADQAEAPPRVYLNVEHIEGEQNPGVSYGVYVNLPDDADETTQDSYHVGNVSFFGIEVSRDLSRDHPGGTGLRYAFDITDLVEELQGQGRWDPATIKVTFVPLLPLPPEGEAAPALTAAEEEPVPPVSIGRVSLFYR